jgi:hypothetical protein
MRPPKTMKAIPAASAAALVRARNAANDSAGARSHRIPPAAVGPHPGSRGCRERRAAAVRSPRDIRGRRGGAAPRAGAVLHRAAPAAPGGGAAPRGGAGGAGRGGGAGQGGQGVISNRYYPKWQKKWAALRVQAGAWHRIFAPGPGRASPGGGQKGLGGAPPAPLTQDGRKRCYTETAIFHAWDWE